MANSQAGDIGGISGERKVEEEESRCMKDTRRHGEETGGTRWKRVTPRDKTQININGLIQVIRASQEQAKAIGQAFIIKRSLCIIVWELAGGTEKNSL